MKVLVLGGYGNFGFRICRALSQEPNVELLIAGRDLTRAQQCVQTLKDKALCMSITAVPLDVSHTNLAQTIKELHVVLLIHTAGPFQGQDYLVAQAAAQADAHYIDLADGRGFVCNFQTQLDEIFKLVNKIAISGASSVPALSSAVIDFLTHQWQTIEDIQICIAPVQKAARGQATIAGVLSYCGEKISVWTQGKWHADIGWSNPKKMTFARIAPRLGALCDVPDLELFPKHYRVKQQVYFRAALELHWVQRMFAFMAYLRRYRLMCAPQRLAKLLNRIGVFLDRFGSESGAMTVQVIGLNASGFRVSRRWDLSADFNYGPEIPCMAAILLARRLIRAHANLADAGLPAGAYPCVGLLKLTEFEQEFNRWEMVVDLSDEIKIGD